jgi:hypothetical protein
MINIAHHNIMRNILFIDGVLLTTLFMTYGYFGLSDEAAVSFAMSLISVMCAIAIQHNAES